MSEVEIKCMQCGLSVDHFLELVETQVGKATPCLPVVNM